MARILLATDGSEIAIGSARRALELFGPDHDYVTLVVIPPSPLVMAAGYAAMGMEAIAAPPPDPEAEAETERARLREADGILDRTLDALGIDAVRRVVHGTAGPEICRVAEEEDFDAVVVGSHGTGLVRRVLVGSVSHYVVNHATRPVLVVRDTEV